MSEYDKILEGWVSAREGAYRNTGEQPVICLMGNITYHAFLGALQIKVNGMHGCGTGRSRVGPITVDGIHIYPESTKEEGYWFGYIDKDVIL